ncbi:PDDEXK-like family protein [Bhargavaea cecembensis]|uniref:PDDEXK-like family protein n=1 Tax=Bhargavaea cecembensis TaxID=394098 RepID=UPI00058B1ECB|nr:PD-(D/E)XK nuclease family protein [Bhargavaea cecembensis]
MTDRESLEQLLMDTELLDRLEARVSGFNMFETLGLVNAEIRHSNMLAWLMSPKENHGLDDVFLKRLMQEVFYLNPGSFGYSQLSLFDISLMDYGTFTVRREYRHMDLLLVSDVEKVVIVIENKIWSSESDHQLGDYHSKIQQEFSDYHQVFLFLTQTGDEASDAENWISVTYEDVLRVLEKSVSLKKNELSPAVTSFIEQYQEVLRRYIVGDEELGRIAREIYSKHKRALDLIYEYKPDVYSEVTDAAEERLKGTDGIIIDSKTKNRVRFVTEKMDPYIDRVSTWTESGRILLFELRSRNEKVVLKLLVGPGQEEVRERYFGLKDKHPAIMKRALGQLTPKITQVYATDLVPRKTFRDLEEDTGAIVDRALENLDRFLKEELPKIERVVEEE